VDHGLLTSLLGVNWDLSLLIGPSIILLMILNILELLLLPLFQSIGHEEKLPLLTLMWVVNIALSGLMGKDVINILLDLILFHAESRRHRFVKPILRRVWPILLLGRADIPEPLGRTLNRHLSNPLLAYDGIFLSLSIQLIIFEALLLSEPFLQAIMLTRANTLLNMALGG
jgi:hypothetical protein